MIKIFLSQKSTTVGDIEGNFEILKESFKKAEFNNCDLFLTTELSLTGYPPQDLLFRKDFFKKIEIFKRKIIKITRNSKTIFALSVPQYEKKKIINSLLLIQSGAIIYKLQKSELPNYGVFDEKRYFTTSKKEPKTFKYKKKNIKFLVCEDMWSEDFFQKKKSRNVDLIIVINASPFEIGKFELRKKIAKKRAIHYKANLIYLNLVGSQDDLIFDGGSFFMNKLGQIISQASFFEESEEIINLLEEKPKKRSYPKINESEKLYRALMISLRHYMKKNNFMSILLGLSGGIDSALSLCVAADAVGSDNVFAFFLPTIYTSEKSRKDAYQLSRNIGVRIQEIPIEKLRQYIGKELNPLFKNYQEDITEENIQSRLRGLILMALSNKFDSLLLTTGNKSELAVGYATLYGDMCGGFSLLKDVYKTKVFELCKWRNKNLTDQFLVKKLNIIPEQIIRKEPTAELRFNQKDSDSLPPYNILDEILDLLIDQNLDLRSIIKRGFDKKTVKNIWMMIKNSEFKRYQSAIGPKITRMSFAGDRRFPLTNKFEI
ncbi:MAG: NAD+ synthase [Pseudomonadota bacterium]|nr:NAD+ synthase [Pseudomonadota bacterium]